MMHLATDKGILDSFLLRSRRFTYISTCRAIDGYGLFNAYYGGRVQGTSWLTASCSNLASLFIPTSGRTYLCKPATFYIPGSKDNDVGVDYVSLTFI